MKEEANGHHCFHEIIVSASVLCRHQQFVGRVKSAVFSSGTQKKRVYVATEQNALAALNLRTGQLGENTLQSCLQNVAYHSDMLIDKLYSP
jgi:hypothetical protein